MLGVLYAISVVWRAVRVLRRAEGLGGRRSSATTGCRRNLDVFALGMGLAVVRAWADGRDRRVAVPRDASAVSTGCGGSLAALCFQAVSFWSGCRRSSCWCRAARRTRRSCSTASLAFFLILPAVFGAQHTGVTRRFLQLRPMVYLGTISYGIYLWHQAFIEKMHQWGGWSKQPVAQRTVPRARDSRARDDDRGRVAELVSSWSGRSCGARTDRCSGARAGRKPRARPHRERAAAAPADADGGPLRRLRRAARARRARDRRAARHVGDAARSRRPALGRYFARLDVGVTIFFVISAFLLYRPFVASHLHAQRRDRARRRSGGGAALRIFPAYWVALTAAILLLPHNRRSVGFWDYARHFLLVQIYQPKYGLAGIVPTWTLAVELSFYSDAAAVRAGCSARSRGASPCTAGSRSSSRRAVLLYAFGLAWHIGVVTTRSTNAVSARWLPAMARLVRARHPARGGVQRVGRVGAGRVAPAVRRPVRRRRVRARDRGVRRGLQHRAAGERDERNRARRHRARGAVRVGRRCCSSRPPRSGSRIGASAMRVLDSRIAVALGTISYGIFLWHYVWIAQLAHVGRLRLDAIGADDLGARDDARAHAGVPRSRAGSWWRSRCSG